MGQLGLIQAMFAHQRFKDFCNRVSAGSCCGVDLHHRSSDLWLYYAL